MDALPSDDDDTRSWIDYDDFGRPLPKSATAEDRRFSGLEGFDSDASDSSIDLHTPLPFDHRPSSPQRRSRYRKASRAPPRRPSSPRWHRPHDGARLER
ncbi:hypothetical protein C0993_001867 [Termitomyces sp. T159_Od127]|nr:hypothetical protein C0993_001867 [Termitomyces sp. T159_Od127]